LLTRDRAARASGDEVSAIAVCSLPWPARARFDEPRVDLRDGRVAESSSAEVARGARFLGLPVGRSLRGVRLDDFFEVAIQQASAGRRQKHDDAVNPAG
jgi:hypothetical protein